MHLTEQILQASLTDSPHLYSSLCAAWTPYRQCTLPAANADQSLIGWPFIIKFHDMQEAR